MTRSYDMTNRSRRAAQTTERIVASAERLLADGPLDDVTLPAIAEGAGVTVQTVLRHMGSRDGCLLAVGERVERRVEAQRQATRPGDVEGAISSLVAHYEAEGRLVLNLLAQEHGGEPVARDGVQRGRSYHRDWVTRVFGLAAGEADRTLVDALVAATDLYVWKLLRLDLGRSRQETEATMIRLARGALADAASDARRSDAHPSDAHPSEAHP